MVESYNERRDCADQRIADFIHACGFLPIPVPNKPEYAVKATKEIKPSGIILVGGNSLVKYGGNATERDETDAALIADAVKSGIPLYGFCRGMQSILDYFGNEIVNVNGHVAVRHRVSGNEESAEVNSYHNQGCLELIDQSLEVVLRADDGVIEKIKHWELPIIGTMWHPEREFPFRETDINLVKTLMGGKE